MTDQPQPAKCDCGMPHLGGTEHADECPAGIVARNPILWPSSNVADGRDEEKDRLREALRALVEASEQYFIGSGVAPLWPRTVEGRKVLDG